MKINKKGQGALEYLLLIGGAILVAVVVITILSGIGGSGGAQAELNSVSALCASKTQGTCAAAPAVVGGTSCNCAWDTTANVCEIDPADATDDCP